MNWLPIESAPKDGTEVVLWCPGRHGYSGYVSLGEYRLDANASPSDRPLWLKNDYDDYSCGYASTPLTPSHWMPLPEAPK